MVFSSILPFEEAIHEFNPQNIISLSPLLIRVEWLALVTKRKKNIILLLPLGPASDNPNPLLEC